MGTPFAVYTPPPRWIFDEELAEIQGRLMTELAVKGPCVVLGRGAFHKLRGSARLFNIMIHAPMGFRVKRVMSIYHARSKAEAVKMIERSDQDRCRYIRNFTSLAWFDSRNYHLTIDTGRVDFATAEEMIVSSVRRLPPNDDWPWVNEPT